MSLTIVPLAQRTDLEAAMWSDELMAAWQEFMLQDPTANLYYARLERFYEFILLAFDEAAPNTVLARGCSVPFCFGEEFCRSVLPDGGWDTVVRWAHQDAFLGRTPNAVSALEIVIRPSAKGQGISALMVAALRSNTARLGFKDLFAPVRPNEKYLEPNTPMHEYAFRLRPDGLPHDAWLWVHVRAGGTILKVAPYSMTIAATLEDWRNWTGLAFDQSGEVIVPGALVPVQTVLEHDYAVYVEPNVWVHHRTVEDQHKSNAGSL